MKKRIRNHIASNKGNVRQMIIWDSYFWKK